MKKFLCLWMMRVSDQADADGGKGDGALPPYGHDAPAIRTWYYSL